MVKIVSQRIVAPQFSVQVRVAALIKVNEMLVQVNYFGLFKAKLSKSSEQVLLCQRANLKDLLLTLVVRYNDKIEPYVFNSTLSDVRNDVIIIINDLPHRQLQGLETILKDGDKVDLMPMFIGGG